jgi:hypothetical protein
MSGTFYTPEALKAIVLELMLLQAFVCGIWFHSLWIRGGRQ